MAEDCGGDDRLTEIKSQLGDRVAAIVRGCSDWLNESEADKAPWRERKEGHLEHLRSADFDVLLVSAVDKLHNARAISTYHLIIGEVVWDRFNAERDSVLWNSGEA